MSRFKTALLATSALLAAVAPQPASAADFAVKAPVVAPIADPWSGLYASFAAGGTSTSAKSSELANFVFTSTNQLPSTSSFSDSLSGQDIGAVFTFAMGYNVVWGRWLVGIQSEVSYNKTLIDATGVGTSIQQSPNNNFSSIFTQDVRADIERNWTVSEMARIGYLVAPDWLVYGLVGWSWSGFDFRGDIDGRVLALPYTLSGLTYGAGVEKNFGWLRAFIQYKGINFDSKSANLPASSTFTQTFNGLTSTSVTSGSDVRRLSADVQEITAGVTIPINFLR